LFASVVAVIAIAAETTTSRIGTALAHGHGRQPSQVHRCRKTASTAL
jgi:hypothetical protein